MQFGENQEYHSKSEFKNRKGNCNGILIGRNLTLLCATHSSASEMDVDNKILLIEDVGEHEYAIDRMLRMLKRAGKFKNIKGLIIGAFSDISEEKIPFGQTENEVILEIVKAYNYPVCFNFPTGHIDNNLCMTLGADVELEIETNQLSFKYI